MSYILRTIVRNGKPEARSGSSLSFAGIRVNQGAPKASDTSDCIRSWKSREVEASIPHLIAELRACSVALAQRIWHLNCEIEDSY